MSTSTITPSFLSQIDLSASPNPKLQAGLTYNSDHEVTIKPEIAAALDPEVAATCSGLLSADRLSEANSLAGCGHLHPVLSYCPDKHDAVAAVAVCHKPLLHRYCGTPESGTAKFAYYNEDLYDHLIHSCFDVLIFTLPVSGRGSRWDCVDGRNKFQEFIHEIERGFAEWRTDGWRWIASFSSNPDYTEFRVIHQGERLPHWPTLQAAWRRIAGNSANISIRTYDGKDEDTQREGMRVAHSGFLSYWAGDYDRLAVSKEFEGEDLTQLYGAFRGFAKASIPKGEPVTCDTCGKEHVPGNGLLLTASELAEGFDHIRTPGYGQRRRHHFGNMVRTHAPPS
jgi:hypothetical protein